MTKAEFIKDCLEYRIRKKELYMWVFMLAFFELIILPILFVDFVQYILISVLILVCIIPVIVYFFSKIMNIKKYFNDYVYCEVVLDKVKNSFFRSRVYFTVIINHNQQKYKCDTLSLFSTAMMDFIYEPLEDYMNKKVLIAYNPTLEEVVVVKKV